MNPLHSNIAIINNSYLVKIWLKENSNIMFKIALQPLISYAYFIKDETFVLDNYFSNILLKSGKCVACKVCKAYEVIQSRDGQEETIDLPQSDRAHK